MKYGKEFQSILESSSFPDDWKHSAIEYRKLKKLIKDVVLELEGMGLSPDVLNRLLVTDARTPAGSEGATPEPASRSDNEREREPEFEFEFEEPGELGAGAAPHQPELRVEELESEHRYRVRLRGREDSPARRPGSAGTSPAPISVSDLMMQRTPSAASSTDLRPRHVRRGVTAEYILDGE